MISNLLNLTKRTIFATINSKFSEDIEMLAYKVTYSKQALKDAKKLSSASLDKKAKELIELN